MLSPNEPLSRNPACGTIPAHNPALAEWVGARPCAQGVDLISARTHLKKNLPIRPWLTAASVCLLPAMLNAQPAVTPPASATPPVDTQPGTSQPSSPSSPSMPASPSMPTQPSQPAGLPQPGGAPMPGGTSQPANTQGSTARDAGDPVFQFRALAGVEHESNALRLPSSSNPGSDEVGILGVGFKADKRYGLQRFRGDIEANTFKYRRQSSLDYSTVNYALAWDWQFTPALHGIVSADRKQFREVTTDPVAFLNRVGRRTERAELVEGIYDFGARWRLMAGASHTQSSSSVPASWDASPSVTSARIGAGYELANGTTMWGRLRRGDGEYKDPTPGASSGDFRETEADFTVKLPVTAKTTVEGRVGRLERNHSTTPQRDFSGLVGSATVNWEITGKTRLAAGFTRDLGATGLANGGHVEHHRFYVGPVWKATAQIAVNARYDRVSRDWKDVPFGSPEVGRNETIQMLSAGIDWEPRRWLTVSGYVRNERMKSNLTTGYRSNTVGAAVKAFF
jgi:exopolysaccharide biosynthesis operon protein EpsL